MRGNPPARFGGGRSEKDWPRYHQKGFLAGRSTKQHLAGPLPYLRHSAATILLVAGVHPKVVQERLGHSTIAMTLDVYSHVLPSMQQEAAGKIDDLFKHR